MKVGDKISLFENKSYTGCVRGVARSWSEYNLYDFNWQRLPTGLFFIIGIYRNFDVKLRNDFIVLFSCELGGIISTPITALFECKVL